MPRIRLSRKARFKSALAFCGMTQHDWALKEGVTPEYLSMVISEKQPRESKTLEAKIDAFIDDVESKVKAAA